MTNVVFYGFLPMIIIWYSVPRGAARKTTYSVIYTVVYLLLIGGARNIETGEIVDSTYGLFGIMLVAAIFGYLHGLYRLVTERFRPEENQDDQGATTSDSLFVEDAIPAEKLNIVTADTETLSNLPGIGPIRAKKIRQYTENGGKFASFEEFAEFLNLKDFERERIKEFIDLSVTLDAEDKTKPKYRGRVIDV